MRMILFTAWRNIWRHRSRSLVVMIALMLGLWAGNFIMAFAFGVYDQRIKTALRYEIGHLQIHHPEFEVDGKTELIIPNGDDWLRRVREQEEVQAVSARVVAPYAMIQASRGAGGVRIVGVNPADEAAVSELSSLIVEGDYFLEDKKRQILIGQALAEQLKLKVGSRPVLNTQGADGEFSASKYRVVGLFKSANSSFDKSRVYVLDQDLQKQLGLPNGSVHEITAILQDSRDADSLAANLKSGSEEIVLIEGWKDVAPELELFIESADQYFYVFIGIILFAVALGVINTMLMAVYDRVRELGMLMAIGMNRRRVFAMIVLETVFLMAAAAPLGLLIAWGSIEYMSVQGLNLSAFSEGYASMGIDPLIYPKLEGSYYFKNLILLLVVALISSLFPAWAALRLDPVKAIRKL